MRKQIWELGSNGYAVMRDNQISEQREFEYMQEREALKPYLILKYNITDIENPTKLVNSLNYIVEMIIDGQIVEPVTEFTFTTLGDHEVRFKYEDSALKDTNGKVGGFAHLPNLVEIVKIPSDLIVFQRSNGFYQCENLRKANLRTYGGNLQILSTSLFYNCYNLEEVILPNTLKTLEYSIFSYNKKIKELKIPDSVTLINAPALQYMEGLEKLILSNGLDRVHPAAFMNISNLKEVVFTKSIKAIESGAFQCAGFEKLDLSNTNIEIIRRSAFYNCTKLKEVILPNTVKIIEEGAFSSCSNIEKVKLSESLTEITGNNWSYTKIREISIPKSVKVIKSYALRNFNQLEKLDLSNTNIEIIEENAISGDIIKELILPNSLKQIYSNSLSVSKLEKIVFPKKMEIIPERFCSSQYNLKEVVLPENVKTIKNGAFQYCRGLQKINLPETIEVIEQRAFCHCNSLEYIFIPKNVELGPEALCEIKYIDIDEKHPKYKSLKDNNVIIDTVTNSMIYIIDASKEVVIPETIDTLEAGCLEGCINNTLIIPDNVVSIKNIMDIGTVETLIIGEGITSIPDNFTYSKCLKHIVLGSNIKQIGRYLIDTSTNILESITCKAVEAPTISMYTFSQINEGGVLRVPDKTKYSSWMSTGSYYLGKYNWTIENIE